MLEDLSTRQLIRSELTELGFRSLEGGLREKLHPLEMSGVQGNFNRTYKVLMKFCQKLQPCSLDSERLIHIVRESLQVCLSGYG